MKGKRGFRVSSFICLLILLSLGASALSTFPSQTEISEYHRQQTFIITILNDGPKTEEVRIMVDPYSSYLEQYILIEPDSFKIASNSRRNIELITSFPSTLSPETHRLRLIPVTKDMMGQASEFTFTVPGQARHDLSIGSIAAADMTTDEALMIDITLNNRGNVIAWATPIIRIYNGSGLIDEIEYRSLVQIMPQTTYELSLRHDLFEPSPGEYSVVARFSYNDGLISTEETKETFSIIDEPQHAVSSVPVAYIIYPTLGAIVLIMIFIFIRKPHRFTSPHRRVRKLNARIRKLERELDKTVQETDQFIHRANTYLDSRFGEGRYGFR